MGYSPQGRKELDMTERFHFRYTYKQIHTNNTYTYTQIHRNMHTLIYKHVLVCVLCVVWISLNLWISWEELTF